MKIFTYPSEEGGKRVAEIINRGLGFSEEDYKQVLGYIENVKAHGDKALVDYTNKFDSKFVTEKNLKVTPEEFEWAEQQVKYSSNHGADKQSSNHGVNHGADKQSNNQADNTFLKALDRAIEQLIRFHQKQKQNSWIDNPRDGVMVGQLVRPVTAAGIYAPGAKGGTTPLVSSVLMGAIPAKVAGVESISLMTPPMSDGTVNPYMLVAARRVGVHQVFKAGSAWAIAALAYGTEQVPKVDIIVGPGNLYVTLAKKIVSGTVGIDMIAGPSEILIIADKDANPKFLAADLLSQAEHDVMASAILVTDSNDLAIQTSMQVESQLKALSRKETAEKSIDNFGLIMVVPDIETAITLSNRLAPEHLELVVKEPFQYIGKIKNAGALFIGSYTPEPVGDYIAGPNHVLPTAGSARFSSALSVDHFIKKTSLINYSQSAFEKEAQDIITLADIEGLSAHANSIKVRIQDVSSH